MVNRENTRQMNFMEAVKAMKEGKKVRRRDWGKGIAIHPHDDIFCYYKCNEGVSSGCSISDVEATDWEVVEEEKKTLSDKVIPFEETPLLIKKGISADTDLLLANDVKQFIKEIKEDLIKNSYVNSNALAPKQIDFIFHKRAGERLM